MRDSRRSQDADAECDSDGRDFILFKADDKKIAIPNQRDASDFVVGKFDKWYPAIFMPRWASRINLEIVSTRVERVQEITEADAIAEGFSDRDAFAELWKILNAKRGHPWKSNPFVWVVEFKRV